MSGTCERWAGRQGGDGDRGDEYLHDTSPIRFLFTLPSLRWSGRAHFILDERSRAESPGQTLTFVHAVRLATEMALNVLAYNMKRVMAILGVSELMEAMLA